MMKNLKVQIDLEREWLELHEGDVSVYLKSSSGDHKYLFNRNSGVKLLNKLRNLAATDDIIKELSREQYSDFTLIYRQTDCTYLKSDIVRTYPLYYVKDNQGYLIKDRLSIREKHAADEESVEEFIATGYISGSNTIYSGVRGIQAAEIITIKNDLEQHRYFYNKTEEYIGLNEQFDVDKRAKNLDNLFLSVFSEMLQTVPDDAAIIVPLSGGHDSRLIVNYLYRLGCRNVICYSYGTAGNKQSEISRKVAEALGFEWHFVEYTEEKWKELHDNGQIEKYFNFAFGGVSTPHLQDFLAVYELRNRGIINKGDVVVPGHGLDILCHIIDADEYEIDIVTASIKRTIWKKKYYKHKKSAVQKRYREIYNDFPYGDKFFPDHIYWQERQSKFIINSLRVYEFFGFQARIPFWNRKIVNFWLSVPMQLKFNRNLFFEMEQTALICEELRDIPYNKGRIVNRSEINNKLAPTRFKWLIPNFLKLAYLRYTRRKPVQAEALNLIYSRNVEDVSGLIKDLNRWPVSAKKFFKKDLKRLPFQVNHELLIRIHTLEQVIGNEK